MAKSLDEIRNYLDDVRIPLRLACTTASGWPLVLSLWFHYDHGRLYCATQETAKVVAYLTNNPQCGFEIAEDQPPYCGVRGQAKAEIRHDLGAEILKKLLLRYLGTHDHPLAERLLSKRETEVAIVLEPVWIYTWDFSGRMQNVSTPSRDPYSKICP